MSRHSCRPISKTNEGKKQRSLSTVDLASLSIRLARARKSLLAAFDEKPEGRCQTVAAQDASAQIKLTADDTTCLSRDGTSDSGLNYGKGTSLERQFLDLERSDPIEADLNDLKRSLRKETANNGSLDCSS
jgi:hypothetical protein